MALSKSFRVLPFSLVFGDDDENDKVDGDSSVTLVKWTLSA